MKAIQNRSVTKIITSFLVIVFFFLASPLFGQSTGIKKFDIQYEPVVVAEGDTMVRITCVIELKDTTSIARVHFKVGSKDSLDDKCSLVFPFSLNKNEAWTGKPEEKMAFKKEGYLLYITIGEMYYQQLFYEIQLEEKHGMLYTNMKRKTLE